MSKLRDVQNLGAMSMKLERIDKEIEQLQRVLSRLMLQKDKIDRDLTKLEQDSGIDLNRKGKKVGVSS